MKHTVAAERESLSLALRSSENDYLSIEPQDVDVSATKYGGVWRRISEISEGWLVVTCGAITSVALLLILLSLLGVFAPRQTQTAVDPLKRLVNNREDRLPYDLTEGDWHNVDAAQDLLKIIEEERQHNTLSGKVLDKLDASDREKFQERHDLDVLFDPNKSLSDLDRDSVVQRLKEEAMSKKAGRLDGRGKKAAWNKYNSFKGKKGKAKGKRDDEDDDDGDEETGDDSVSPSASVSPSKSSETESGDLSVSCSPSLFSSIPPPASSSASSSNSPPPSNSPAASSPSSPSSSSSSPSSSPSSSSSRSPSSSSSSSSSPSYSSSSSPSCSASSTRTPSSSVSLSPTASISVSPTSSRSPNPSLSPTSSRSPNPSLSPNSSPAAPVVVLVVDDFSSNPVQGEILDAAPPDQFVGLVQVGASLLGGTRTVTATKTGGAAGTRFFTYIDTTGNGEFGLENNAAVTGFAACRWDGRAAGSAVNVDQFLLNLNLAATPLAMRLVVTKSNTVGQAVLVLQRSTDLFASTSVTIPATSSAVTLTKNLSGTDFTVSGGTMNDILSNLNAIELVLNGAGVSGWVVSVDSLKFVNA